MFKEQTVFILGAGASWHYGYPTGEELVKSVTTKAAIAERFFDYGHRVMHADRPQYLGDGELGTSWQKARDECRKLRAGLEQVRPLVIDYYLGWNPDLQGIGRLLIAWVILECEARYQQFRRNLNRDMSARANDDWYRFIIHQLAIHCRDSSDLLLNKVSFVTFNYDVSLENSLRSGLSHIQMFEADDVEQFLGGSRIIHVYGRIRDDVANAAEVDWTEQETNPGTLQQSGDYHATMKNLLDVVYVASKGLRVIDPHDKGADDAEIKSAREAIAGGQRTFVLGYGFDEHNSDRLNLPEYFGHNPALLNKRIAFTNYQDINQINKRASKVFYGHPNAFPPGSPAIADRYEKSTRSTYDALAFDFDIAG